VSQRPRVAVLDYGSGNIRSAQAQLMRSQAEVSRVELSLRRRFARQYARYRTARTQAEEYRRHIVPESREAFELYLDSFRRRRAAYPQVLVAQLEVHGQAHAPRRGGPTELGHTERILQYLH